MHPLSFASGDISLKHVSLHDSSFSIRRVNLGCGSCVAAGWVNIDNSPGARIARYPWLRWLLWKFKIISDRQYEVPWPKDLVLRDLTRDLPFADCSIDYVYSSHALEHFARSQAQKLLTEIYRVLKKGGVLRLVVPDLTFGARRYIAALEANPLDEMAAPEFLNWLRLSKPGMRTPHLWMYDVPSLRAELLAVGFIHVQAKDYKQGDVPDREILDNRPVDSLHIEAQKA